MKPVMSGIVLMLHAFERCLAGYADECVLVKTSNCNQKNKFPAIVGSM